MTGLREGRDREGREVTGRKIKVSGLRKVMGVTDDSKGR